MRCNRTVLVPFLLLVGCGPPPAPEAPTEPVVDVAVPLPAPSAPEVRCRRDRSAELAIEAERVVLVPSDSGMSLALVGPGAVRVASVDPEGRLVEARTPLVKLQRVAATAVPAGSEHVVVVEASPLRRGAGSLALTRFATSGARVGKSLRIERADAASAAVLAACSGEHCLVSWAKAGGEGGDVVHVARVVSLGDEGATVVGAEEVTLPGAPLALQRQGDGFVFVVGDRVHTIDPSDGLGEPVPLTTGRGGQMRLAESPTGSRASLFVESAMPYGLAVSVVRDAAEPPATTRLWEGASEERRVALAAGQLGFGAAWARPEGDAGPYVEETSGLARLAFRGFAVGGTPHGPEVPLAEGPVVVSSLDLVGTPSGYVAAWSTPSGRRTEPRVQVAWLSCRELTPEEAAAEDAASPPRSPLGEPGGEE